MLLLAINFLKLSRISLELCVHLINLSLVNLFAYITLELECGCCNVVCWGEIIIGNPDVLGLLETVEFARTAKLVHLVEDNLLVGSVLGLIDGVNIFAVFSGPFGRRILFWNDNGNNA